jgi:hypothetical protein
MEIKPFTISRRRNRVIATETHTWDTANSVDCHLSMKWAPIGRVVLSGDRLEFPVAQPAPAVYRFRVRSGGSSEPVYFGETENLDNRFTLYRNAHSSQGTNFPLKNLFHEVLSSGGEVAVAVVAPDAWVDFGGTRVTADFSSKFVRRMFENTAIVESHGTSIESLNR